MLAFLVLVKSIRGPPRIWRENIFKKRERERHPKTQRWKQRDRKVANCPFLKYKLLSVTAYALAGVS